MVSETKTETGPGLRIKRWSGILFVLIQILRALRGFFAIIVIAVTMLLTYPPIYLWRHFAIKMSKWMQYDKIFGPMDILPYEDIREATDAPRCALVTVAVVRGDLNLSHVQKIFEDAVLNAKVESPEGKKLRYPKLRQHEVRLLGFRFLKNCESFKLTEHIVESYNTVSTLREIHQTMRNRRFVPGKSPWELVVFRKAIPEHTALAFRIHHSLADGLSLLKMFVECIGGKSLVKAKAHEMQMSMWSKLCLPISLGNDCVNLWTDTVRELLKERLFKERKSPSIGPGRVCHVGLSERIPIENVKFVAESYGITSSACIIAGIVGGLETFLRLQRRNSFDTALKNGNISLGYVLPLEGHPTSFTNHWTTTYDTVEFGYMGKKCTAERLQSFNTAFLKMKSSTRRIFLKYSVLLCGESPVALAKALLRNRVCSIAMTNIAGEEEGFQVAGKDCVEFSLTCGGLDGVDLVFCLMSYKGMFRVGCISDNRVMEESEVMKLSECVYQEFNRLMSSVIKMTDGDAAGEAMEKVNGRS